MVRNVLKYMPGDRVIEGYGIVDVYDNQGELITVEDTVKQMEELMKRGGIIMDLHTNRPSGKLVDYDVRIKTTKEGPKPALYLKTTAFKGTEEDDEFWERFKKYYHGFSVGGGKPKKTFTGQGFKLKFPLWEFSYVPKPANPEATITEKYVAKSNELFSCNITKADVVTKPEWVQDEDTWDKAKQEAKDSYPDIDEDNKFWAIVTEIYKRMGGKVEKQDNGLDEVYSKFNKLVNMSSSEIERFADSECSNEASLNPGKVRQRLQTLLDKKKDEWDSDDIKNANRVVSFISRMKGAEQGKPASSECEDSKRDISLQNWGHDPNKTNKGEVKAMEDNKNATAAKPDEMSTLKQAMEGYEKRLGEVEKYMKTKKEESESEDKEKKEPKDEETEKQEDEDKKDKEEIKKMFAEVMKKLDTVKKSEEEPKDEKPEEDKEKDKPKAPELAVKKGTEDPLASYKAAGLL